MSAITLIIELAIAAKKYAPVVAAVASGIGMILSKNYDQGLNTIFQALTLIFGGASVATLQHAVAKAAPG